MSDKTERCENCFGFVPSTNLYGKPTGFGGCNRGRHATNLKGNLRRTCGLFSVGMLHAPASKFTPGPWKVTPAGYISSNGEGFVPIIIPFTAEAHRNKFGGATPEAMANAKLAAAAPELLGALKVAMQWVDNVASWKEGMMLSGAEMNEQKALIGALIAKAEGRS